MINIEKAHVVGFEDAIRGMRNPMNSWDRMDSVQTADSYSIGPKDYTLMRNLASSGPVHAKYRRMIVVYADITAPLYWWKEFDTYKVGTVANSCSTMHKIAEKEFEWTDFSTEHLLRTNDSEAGAIAPTIMMEDIIFVLNYWRRKYLESKSKDDWWQMIQLLPSSYNQKRTIMLNYEVLTDIYSSRKNHKLDEWAKFCGWIHGLPCSELITGE